MGHHEEYVPTNPLGSLEGLDIHRAVEVFNNLGQVRFEFFNRARAADRSRYNHQHVSNL